MQRRRIKFFPNEKATYVKLRRRGYSMNQLSRYFGRSTSVIRGILMVGEYYNILRYIDLRKLSNKIRLHFVSCQRRMMEKLLSRWEDFMLGVEEEPP